MGIIKRQGIKYSVVGYTATVIGAIATLFIYPLDKSIYGYALFLVSTATLFYPFFSGGLVSLTIRFFPEMRSEDGSNNGFLLFIQLSLVVVFSLLIVVTLYFEDFLILTGSWFVKDVKLLIDNIIPILILTFLITQINTLIHYVSNYQRIVVPSIITNLLFKIILPILVLLFYYGVISQTAFGWGVIGYHFFGFLGLMVYLYIVGGLDWKINFKAYNRARLKKMLTYATYGILGSIGNVLAFRIDLFMVPTMLGLLSTGIYGISQFIGASVELPAKALFQISAPIVSKAMEEKDVDHVRMIYHKASLNLTIVGLILLVLIMGSLDALLYLTNDYESLKAGKMVVFWIAMTKLVDMATSVNSHIIGYSKYFRVNFYIVMILAVLNISFNLWLIPLIGITGAALATFLSIAISNTIRFLYVWYRWDMQPFSYKHLIVIGISLFAFIVANLFPLAGLHPLFNIIIRSTIIVGISVPVILYLRLSADINDLANKAYGRFLNLINSNR